MKHITHLFIVIPLFFFACSSIPDNPERDIAEWKSIERDLQAQFINTPDSTTIELPAGNFLFSRSLLMDNKKNVTIKGAGMDKTILSFSAQEEGAEGIKISNSLNIVLQDFTIEDAKGDNIKVNDTNGITFRNIKSQWTGEPKETNGAYALYPVICKNVLLEGCIAIGASDAGVYVGQSDSVIIRNNEAYLNVAGIESENSRWVEIYGNNAHHNTGGILVFDLPGLTQYGHTTKVYNNQVANNNYKNFAPEGNIVATVPPGTGVMLLATRNIELFDNSIIDNKTLGIGIASYDLVEAMTSESSEDDVIPTSQKDKNYDPYPNQLYIHDNQISNSNTFPTMQSDFGLLFLTKFPFSTPDIVWDGIAPDPTAFRLCITENESVKIANLDAANDFEGLSSDPKPFQCDGEPVNVSVSL